MGGKISTPHDADKDLRKEEIDHMCQLFVQVCKQKPEKGCTYGDFIKFCDVLHPLLTKFLEKFYFDVNSDYIIKSVKEFSSFYLFLVRGSVENQAKVMEVILLELHLDSSRDIFLSGSSAFRKFSSLLINFDIDEETFKTNADNYFRGLICSYIKLEYTVECEEFLSWRYVKSSFSPADVDRLAETLSESCPRPLSPENFEKWVNNWKAIRYLHYVVYNNLYGMQTIERAVLQSLYPLCLVKSKRAICIMDMCSILYLNCYLPASFRHTWKLLFSSSQHGVDYQHLMKRILFEGPTIVVIKDVNNYVFGGFASESWRPNTRFYGYCDSFLFQSKPKLHIYEPSGRDDGYQYIHVKNKPQGFGMGKGPWGDFGWWIEPERMQGSCGETCSTFENVPILASAQFFKIDEFEVWSVEDSKTKKHKEHAVRFHTLAVADPDQSNLRVAGQALLKHTGNPRYKSGYGASTREEKWRKLEGEDRSDHSFRMKDAPQEEKDDDVDSDEDD